MKKLLVLDLDQTLIQSSELPIDDYHFIYRTGYSTVWIKKRPGLDNFLSEIFDLYDVAIWSYGTDDYVKLIIQAIAPTYDFVFIWTRKRCTLRRISNVECNLDTGMPQNTYHIKKLSKIWRKRTNNYNKYNTVVIDDTPITYINNYGNAIPIKEYNGQTYDLEFDIILKILNKLIAYDNVRLGLKNIKQISRPP